jgi:hypothetical protein
VEGKWLAQEDEREILASTLLNMVILEALNMHKVNI